MAKLLVLAGLTIVALGACTTVQRQRPNLTTWEADKKAKAEAAEAKAKDQAKMAAVNKVLTLLEDLQIKVLAEGEFEAQTYNKFACWCKDTSKAKTDAITAGTSAKDSLTAEITKLASDRDTLDTEIKECTDDIDKTNKEMKEATTKRKETEALYEKNSADMAGAIAGLESAIQALKASKPSSSFLQLQGVAKNVQQAVLMADALGLGDDADKHTVASFVQNAGSQAPEVEMEDYKFHSASIITTLEKLLKEFTATKNEVNKDEVQSVHEYEMLMQEKTDHLKAKELELSQAQESKSSTVAELEAKSQELTTTAATLLDDQAYIQELSTNCKEKQQTWTQRSTLRADELQAVTEAIDIIKTKVKTKISSATMRLSQQAVRVRLAQAVVHSPSAMEAIEAEAEAAENGPIGFLQRERSASHQPNIDGGRQAVADLLRQKGAKFKSTMLSALANQITQVQEKDVFAKIKTLIQELIEKLLKEESAEADMKGYCDKATADTKQKRDYADADVRDLNAKMAELQATKNTLSEAIATLTAEKEALEAAQTKADELRAQEAAESAAAITEAEAGLEGINEAITLLVDFYKKSAKAKVSLAQDDQPDAPDAGFENFEAYTGAGSDFSGILGMMDVIKSDLMRTISETKKSEAEAIQEHKEFTTATQSSIKEKETSIAQFTTQLNTASEDYTTAETSFNARSSVLLSAVEELIVLKGKCIDTGMSYDTRVARREEEITALKQGLCILNAYKDFSTTGVPDSCYQIE